MAAESALAFRALSASVAFIARVSFPAADQIGESHRRAVWPEPRRAVFRHDDLGAAAGPDADAALAWLLSNQHRDGGWSGGGTSDAPSSIEETALAIEALKPAASTETNTNVHMRTMKNFFTFSP